MDNPDATVTVEVREDHAYVHADAVKGAGGMPIGTAGRAMLLLSGGIDSPVAGYMMAKRGAKIEAVHFESFPYTSDAAKEKVLELARLMSAYCGTVRVNCISVTEIQERLRDTVQEEYFTLLLRRVMMRLAARVAKVRGCGALITGESLGQVASQTMLAMGVTDPAADMLVFRPCIGLDKEEIIETARKINTFETSILPYEDCCTVFTPRHPKTRPELVKVLIEEEKADLSALEDEAISKLEVKFMSMYE
jgi:thiamine biosynthesis protein ThiI